MTDPFLDSLATALAGQAAAALGAAGKAAVQKIRDLLRKRSGQDPETLAALEAAEQPSAEPRVITALAERLDRVAKEDPELAELIRAASTTIHHEQFTGEVVNKNTGSVQNLVQARDINGPITFH